MTGWERYGGGSIVICDYDLAWPQMFDQERLRLRDVLGSLAVVIEHVGSTAVPGLAAKPMIDLLVGVRSLDAARSRCVEPLWSLGYTYLAHYESWLPGEMLFRKGMPGPWTHHVHVTEPAGPRWDELILIRDYLRRHPEIASAYGHLKKALALVFEGDIAGYRAGKGPFLAQVMAKARAERE
ncbi:MAG: GrpB family protein [Chloroflexi bacterium]|nr:GrpB family protein [Chloroflexota bacterium]